MSLYDDFDDVAKPKNASWNAGLAPSINLMQAHVNNLKRQAKRQSQQTSTPKSTTTLDVKRSANEGEFRFNHITGKMEKYVPGVSDFNLSYDDPLLRLGVKDEYNPLYPNDFEQISKIIVEKKKIEEKLKEEKLDNEYERPKIGVDKPKLGTAIAPPPSLLEDCTIFPNGEKNVEVSNDENAAAVAATQAKYGTTSAAAKIMVKMGFKEGKGLGREGQGMSTALQVEKTSRRQGKIIHEKDLINQQMVNQEFQTQFTERFSNVILLRNMVGPGEVDDDLQPETAEECSKYGQVVTCMIFELQDAPDDQAVRIFVEFSDVEGAIKAVEDLNGRYFGGRVVSAGFYDSEKFKNLELTDDPWFLMINLC